VTDLQHVFFLLLLLLPRYGYQKRQRQRQQQMASLFAAPRSLASLHETPPSFKSSEDATLVPRDTWNGVHRLAGFLLAR
jgi:hypothetical protein